MRTVSLHFAVRARLAKRPKDWAWSSAAAHLAGRDDALVTVAPLLDRIGDWKTFLKGGLEDTTLDEIRGHERTGRPLGAAPFVERLELRLGRPLAPRKPGPAPKTAVRTRGS